MVANVFPKFRRHPGGRSGEGDYVAGFYSRKLHAEISGVIRGEIPEATTPSSETRRKQGRRS